MPIYIIYLFILRVDIVLVVSYIWGKEDNTLTTISQYKQLSLFIIEQIFQGQVQLYSTPDEMSAPIYT